jgi:hypothetical protein
MEAIAFANIGGEELSKRFFALAIESPAIKEVRSSQA